MRITVTPRKGLRALLLAAAVVWLTMLCAPYAHAANPPEQLLVAKGGSGTGTITSSPPGINCGANCSASFDQGTSVTLTATPAPGSRFSGWSGDCTGTDPTCTLTMDAGKTATANFIATPTLKVQLVGTGQGTVVSSPPGINCGTACSASYDVNTKVTLFAGAAAGSRFAGWSGGGCAGTRTCTVRLAQTTQVSARFNALVTLTIANSGTGAGTVTSSPAGINCGTLCSAAFDLGTKVRIAAHPAHGWRFLGWIGTGCSGTAACAFTITQSTVIGADFGQFVVAPNTRIGHLKVRRAKHGRRGRAKIWFSGSRGTGTYKFLCKIDHKRFKPCRPPKTYRHLRKGRHTIQVRAVDSAGTVDPTPALIRFKT